MLEVVNEANVAFEYDIESILRKDSLDMTDNLEKNCFEEVTESDRH